MNLHQLYYFRTVAEFEHYTLAASKLMVSPSSLSHAISDLEKELGVPLFEPQGRNIRLTEYGKLYLSYVSTALDTLDQGNAHLRNVVDPKSCTISMACVSSLNGLIPHIISKYLAETGNAQTKFLFSPAVMRTIDAGLLDGSIDLAFSSGCDSPQLNIHSLGSQELVAVVSTNHPLAARDEIALADLASEKLITYNKDLRIRTYIDTILQSASVCPEVITEGIVDDFLISVVAADLGVALIPRPLTAPPQPIKILKITDAVPPRNIYLVWRKVRYMSPGAKSFLDFILSHDTMLQEMLNAQR